MSPRTRFALLLFSLAALVLGGCGSAGAPSAPSSVGPSPANATPAVEPTQGATQGPTPASTASASFSAEPTAGPTPEPTVGPTPSPASAAGYTCSYPLERAASSSAMAAVHDVRVGTHSTYDRIVFEFLDTGVPQLVIERAQPPFTRDPSGLALAVPGSSFIRIRMLQTSGAGYARPDGQPTYAGPSRFEPGYAGLTSLVQAGDFEGVSTWIAGLTGPMCYRVSTLADPARLVIDLRAP